MDVLDQSDFITCRSCSNVFVYPRILRCGHTFCSNCLNRLIQNSSCDDDAVVEVSVRKISCPTCKKDMKFKSELTVNNLKPNYFIEELISIKQNLIIYHEPIFPDCNFLTLNDAPRQIAKNQVKIESRLKMLSEDGDVLQQRLTVFKRNVNLVKQKIKHSEANNEMELLENLKTYYRRFKEEFKTKKILNRVLKISLEKLKDATDDCSYYRNFIHFTKNLHPESENFFKDLELEKRNIDFPKIKLRWCDNRCGSLILTYPNDKFKKSFKNETKIVKILKTSEKPRTTSYRCNRNQLFVIFSNSSGTQISIYKCSNYSKLNVMMKLNQVQNANDLCIVDDLLFITERSGQYLHKVDCSALDLELMKPNPRSTLDIFQTTGWTLHSYNDGLSVTCRKTLLISSNATNEILEYDTNGLCLCKVKLPNIITNPRHAIIVPKNFETRYSTIGDAGDRDVRKEMSPFKKKSHGSKNNDYYIVCNAGAIHKCYVIDPNGNVVRESTLDVNLKYPVSLACHHRNKNSDGDVGEEDLEIIVCDRMNNRLLLFDMDLHLSKEITPYIDGAENGITATTSTNAKYKFKRPLKVLLIKNEDEYDDAGVDGDDDDDEILLVVVDEDNSSIVFLKSYSDTF